MNQQNIPIMKLIHAIIMAAALLCGCASYQPTAEADWEEVSWRAFCDARGHSYDDESSATVNEYLDTWRGSGDEDNALEAAGFNIDEL